MGKLVHSFCQTLFIIWIMIAMLSLVWGVMYHDIGSIGFTGWIFIWIYFWETDDSNEYRFMKRK